MDQRNKRSGRVYLVGAGPGDPLLITKKAEQVIKQADVILYDRLVDRQISSIFPKSAELVDVGKESDYHKVPQSKINELMIDRARRGKVVVRLKGGDPYVFGRGGEEAQELSAHGVHVDVIPGVSSAVAVPAAAGIPVTHRQYASSLTIITGHEAGENTTQWDVLAKLNGTLVILMGVSNFKRNIEALTKFGKPPETPAAIIENGTTPQQKVIRGTLATIVEKAEKEGIKAPAVIVVGDVVNVRATTDNQTTS
jgi:uroporphyrin-III C-methyltransferase